MCVTLNSCIFLFFFLNIPITLLAQLMEHVRAMLNLDTWIFKNKTQITKEITPYHPQDLYSLFSETSTIFFQVTNRYPPFNRCYDWLMETNKCLIRALS